MSFDKEKMNRIKASQPFFLPPAAFSQDNFCLSSFNKDCDENFENLNQAKYSVEKFYQRVRSNSQNHICMENKMNHSESESVQESSDLSSDISMSDCSFCFPSSSKSYQSDDSSDKSSDGSDMVDNDVVQANKLLIQNDTQISYDLQNENFQLPPPASGELFRPRPINEFGQEVKGKVHHDSILNFLKSQSEFQNGSDANLCSWSLKSAFKH